MLGEPMKSWLTFAPGFSAKILCLILEAGIDHISCPVRDRRGGIILRKPQGGAGVGVRGRSPAKHRNRALGFRESTVISGAAGCGNSRTGRSGTGSCRMSPL